MNGGDCSFDLTQQGKTMYLKQAAVVFALIASGLGPAWAQQVPADKAVKYRQAAFTLMGAHMTRLNAALKGDAPSDKNSLAFSGDVIELMGRAAFEGFVPGGDQTGSKALPAMWKEMPKFKELTVAMQAEAVKLKAATQSGDTAKVKAAFAATAKACKACHDPYLGK
jgi:cytochrome c556